MATYETVFITRPNVPEDEERALVDGFAGIVTGGGGTFTANERMGRRRLAYPIRKFDDGVYYRFLYDSEMAVPKELERRFRLSELVLRMLTVRLEPEWARAAKEQAVRDAERREEAERLAALEAEQAALRGEAGAPAEPADDEGGSRSARAGDASASRDADDDEDRRGESEDER